MCGERIDRVGIHLYVCVHISIRVCLCVYGWVCVCGGGVSRRMQFSRRAGVRLCEESTHPIPAFHSILPRYYQDALRAVSLTEALEVSACALRVCMHLMGVLVLGCILCFINDFSACRRAVHGRGLECAGARRYSNPQSSPQQP